MEQKCAHFHIMQKSISQDEVKFQSLLFNIVYALFVPGHIPGISVACSGQAVLRPGEVLSISHAELAWIGRLISVYIL